MEGIFPHTVYERVTEAPQNNTGYYHCFGCLPERATKNLLLKMPHTLLIGSEESKIVLTWKLPLFSLVLIVVGGAMERVGGEKASTVLPRREPC